MGEINIKTGFIILVICNFNLLFGELKTDQSQGE